MQNYQEELLKNLLLSAGEKLSWGIIRIDWVLSIVLQKVGVVSPRVCCDRIIQPAGIIA